MPEKTLNEALSGGEIREIIAQEIEKRLKGDCTLAEDLSYAGFIAKFDIKIQYLRSLTKETLIWGATTEVKDQNSEPAGEISISGLTSLLLRPTSSASSTICPFRSLSRPPRALRGKR